MPDTVTDVAEIDFAVARTAAEMVVAQPQPAQEVATVPDGDMHSLIERMARDPAVNIDKLERLIAMQDRMEERRARVSYDNSMADAQEAMKPIRANLENSQTKSEYADYAALDSAIRPIYAKHGFSLSFDTGDGAPAGEVRVICKVAHRGGHREFPHLDMPADGKGAKGGDVMTKTHATGAAITYSKRYLLGMIFNLAVTRDDDGNGATFDDDDDVQRLAGKDAARDPVTGKLRSTYDAGKAQKAKEAADNWIEMLNTAPNVEAAKEWRRTYSTVAPGKRKSPLQTLEDNSPGQFMRVKTCFENVTGEEF